MKAKLYRIQCLTNLHVGGGDVNFNIIDREVERDPITKYPVIPASGIKGALRIHLENQQEPEEVTDALFGTANSMENNGNGAGRVKFFTGNMLALPMRVSRGQRPYVLVTTWQALEDLQQLSEAICGKAAEVGALQPVQEELQVEEHPVLGTVEVFGQKLYVMEEDHFRQIPLPVTVRNSQQVGRRNLWYEEIVPHKSVLYMLTASSDDSVDVLDAVLKRRDIVQFGGNSSIGCGMCRVEEMVL